MGAVQYYAAMTLDGFIAESDDTLDWLTKYDGSYDGPNAETFKGSYDRFYENVGALVMGSATYQFVLDESDVWHYANVPSWVLTTRDLPVHPGAGDATIHFGPREVTELAEEMRAAAGDRNVWVVGGGNVASQFADAGLIDEVIVTVLPVVLGEGKPLFDRRMPGGPMQLTACHAWDNGMVELSYAVHR
jgi:dihydrofolate reductase